MASAIPAIQRLFKAQLGNALATLWTAPAFPLNGFSQCTSLWIANTDSVAHTFTLRIGTGTTTVADSLGEALAIAANTTYFLSTGDASVFLVLNGEVVQGLADVANKVTITAYGQLTAQ